MHSGKIKFFTTRRSVQGWMERGIFNAGETNRIKVGDELSQYRVAVGPSAEQ